MCCLRHAMMSLTSRWSFNIGVVASRLAAAECVFCGCSSSMWFSLLQASAEATVTTFGWACSAAGCCCYSLVLMVTVTSEMGDMIIFVISTDLSRQHTW